MDSLRKYPDELGILYQKNSHSSPIYDDNLKKKTPPLPPPPIWKGWGTLGSLWIVGCGPAWAPIVPQSAFGSSHRWQIPSKPTSTETGKRARWWSGELFQQTRAWTGRTNRVPDSLVSLYLARCTAEGDGLCTATIFAQRPALGSTCFTKF